MNIPPKLDRDSDTDSHDYSSNHTRSANSSPDPPKAPLQSSANHFSSNINRTLQNKPHNTSPSPWEAIIIDILGPYHRGHNGYTFVLICVDQFTHKVSLKPLRSDHLLHIVDGLRRHIMTYGLFSHFFSRQPQPMNDELITQLVIKLSLPPATQIRCEALSPYFHHFNIADLKNLIESCVLLTHTSEWDTRLQAIETAVNMIIPRPVRTVMSIYNARQQATTSIQAGSPPLTWQHDK